MEQTLNDCKKASNPRAARISLGEYLAMQEGRVWSRSNSEYVVSAAREFDDCIEALMIAAGIRVVSTLPA